MTVSDRLPGTASASVNTIPGSLSKAILRWSRQGGAKPDEKLGVLDSLSAIEQAARILLDECDILVTLSGALRGDRDVARLGGEGGCAFASAQAMPIQAEMLVRIPKETGDLPVRTPVDVYRFWCVCGC